MIKTFSSTRNNQCESCSAFLVLEKDWIYCPNCGYYHNMISGQIEQISRNLVRVLDVSGRPVLLSPATVSYLSEKREANGKAKNQKPNSFTRPFSSNWR